MKPQYYLPIPVSLIVILSIGGLYLVRFLRGDYPPTIQPIQQLEQTEDEKITRINHTGLASWYDYKIPQDINYSAKHFTAASRDYERKTILLVVNLQNGKSVCVRVNDHVENYGVILDLSSAAFAHLADLSEGLIKVEIREHRCVPK